MWVKVSPKIWGPLHNRRIAVATRLSSGHYTIAQHNGAVSFTGCGPLCIFRSFEMTQSLTCVNRAYVAAFSLGMVPSARGSTAIPMACPTGGPVHDRPLQ